MAILATTMRYVKEQMMATKLIVTPGSVDLVRVRKIVAMVRVLAQ